MIVKASNHIAQSLGVYVGMVVADCKAIYPSLQVFDHDVELSSKLLNAIAEWMLRYTPISAVDKPDGIILDISGCPHLWGGEKSYSTDILTKLRQIGYHVRGAISDTVGTSWAISRYGKITPVIDSGKQYEALLTLPPAALRLEPAILEKLDKLGLYQIGKFITMTRSALRRRFGPSILIRLDQALGREIEAIQPIRPIQPHIERLPSLEPVRTAAGIEIALKQLLGQLCKRLEKESKGLRACIFKCHRIDNNIQRIEIGTNRPSRNVEHLFKLFQTKISLIEPDLGIELFLLEASIVEDLDPSQEAIWTSYSNHDEAAISELLDRIESKVGDGFIHRYVPAEHHIPERSFTRARSVNESSQTKWKLDMPRPMRLLYKPEQIQVMVAIPDYPPVSFTHTGKLHNVKRADGPERIEQEWWIEDGDYRDYYVLEDQDGLRYWVFRLGDYNAGEPKWYLHGFFD